MASTSRSPKLIHTLVSASASDVSHDLDRDLMFKLRCHLDRFDTGSKPSPERRAPHRVANRETLKLPSRDALIVAGCFQVSTTGPGKPQFPYAEAGRASCDSRQIFAVKTTEPFSESRLNFW